MTHTPASGPRGPLTTPPMSSLSTATGAVCPIRITRPETTRNAPTHAARISATDNAFRVLIVARPSQKNDSLARDLYTQTGVHDSSADGEHDFGVQIRLHVRCNFKPGARERRRGVKCLTMLSIFCLLLAALWPIGAQQPQPPAQPAQPGQPAGSPAGGGRGRGPAYQLTAEDRQQIHAKLDQLDALVTPLKARRSEDDLMADVEVHAKAAHWVLEFPEDVTNQTDVRNALAVLDRGIERAEQLQKGQSPWTSQKGQVAFGYYSPLDDSVQPYQLTIPESYDGSKPVPLFGWMHGRNAGINTSNFLYAATIGATSKVPDWGQLEVQFLGRGNNASHWAGEVDVYETVAAISRRFKVDSSRLVLRGFSLGGAGAWHVALHNPGMWVAADIGAGTWPRHYLM